MNTIFDTLSLDRNAIQWEDWLGELTPWQNRQGMWFKREDYFAPLGYGGPNGSKLRQLIWMMNRARAGKTHVLTGASIQSPQLSMSAIVGAHYGLRAREVVYSKPHTLLKHPNPYIAAGFGAVFEYASGPYNPIIQRHVEELRQATSLVVEYGITLSHQTHAPEQVRKFHEVGAHQVSNLPADIHKLIVPAGSCNSLTSILLGLAKDSKNLKTLFTLGIGPDKTEWVHKRLQVIGVDINKFEFEWVHYSLHDSKYAAYGDKFKGEEFNGIRFHPTYEAKMWRWLRTTTKMQMNDRLGFWIVGSEPDVDVIRPFFTNQEMKNERLQAA